MKVSITTNIVVTLVLSHDEAAWLHEVMRNPIGDYTPVTEPREDAEMRKKFWEATKPD